MHSTTFLHIADLHIGLRLARFEQSVANRLRESRLQALGNALSAARDNNAEFIVIAGDMFDDNTVDAALVQRAVDAVNNAGIPAYAIPGNHDHARPGSVWQRHAPAAHGSRLQSMLDRAPVQVNPHTVLLPCPVERKISAEDPTAWIPPRATGDNSIRIAVAHGSVMDRPTLPPDDHPIPADCPARRDADYVALGHWHNQKIYRDASGAPRMAYPGTHEQMGFGKDAGAGWLAYAADPALDELQSASRGSALLVTVTRDAHGSTVDVRPVDTGNFSWESEQHGNLDDTALAALAAALEKRAGPEKTLLRLKLDGLVSLRSVPVLDAMRGALQRFVHHDLDTSALLIRPEAGEMADALGRGILPGVFETLSRETDLDPRRAAVREQAALLLYKLCMEAGQ